VLHLVFVGGLEVDIEFGVRLHDRTIKFVVGGLPLAARREDAPLDLSGCGSRVSSRTTSLSVGLPLFTVEISTSFGSPIRAIRMMGVVEACNWRSAASAKRRVASA